MTSTEAGNTDEGEAPETTQKASARADESMRHGGFIDIERFPGGSRLTAVRADLVDRYEGYVSLDPSNKEPVRRWGFGSIVSHWALVATMIVAAVTGFAFWTGWYGPLDVGIWNGYQVSFQLHVWAGVVLAVIALIVFPFYHKFVDGHHLLINWTQIKEQIVIALAFLGLLAYIPGYKQARRAYDEDEEEWVGYHPAQTAFWYATWFFVLVLAFTGFALWKGLATQPAWWVASLGFMDAWFAYERLLQLHLLATFWILAMVFVHAYVAILPGNRDILESMINGTVPAWIVDGDSRPDRQDDDPQRETEGHDD